MAVWFVVAGAVLAWPGAAPADPRVLARAVSLYESGQLVRALGAFERALSSGDNDEDAHRVIYMHLGILRAGAGDAEGAEEAFRQLLALDPAATPPPDSSPVVTEPFERARGAERAAPDLTVPPSEVDADPVVEPAAAAVPRRPTRAREADSNVFRSPWFWGGTAAFVVAALITTIAVSTDSDRPSVRVAGIEHR